MSNDEQNPERARLGDFEIIGELGRGGMGVVYRALQLSLNRRVALKVLKGSFTLTPKSVERFKREAAAAARLHHTNIVPVYSTGTVEDQHYYAMELIEGCSLDRVLDQMRMAQSASELKVPAGAVDPAVVEELEPTLVERPTEADDTSSASSGHSALTSASGVTSGRRYFDSVARLMADVADALDYAHSQGVVHRDIKPGNLILSNENRIYITDFGLARLQEAEGLTVTGGVMGSPHYMSPEQVVPHAEDLDHRTDVYSLGVTLYELLTLRAPFKGVSKAQVLNHILSKEPTRPRRVDRHIPQDLETICLKAMEKRPDRRYATARELADDLRRYVNRFTISARPVSLAERAFRWSQRHPSTAGLIAASVIAIAAISGLWVVNSYRGQLQEINDKLTEALVSEEKARDDAEVARDEAEDARKAADIQKYFGQYVVNIAAANRALERNNGPTAEIHLTAIEDDEGQRGMIGFEWGIMARKLNELKGSRIPGVSGGDLYGCVFSPDKTILAIGGYYQSIQLFYGMPRFTNVVRLSGHEGPLNKLAFSPDGSLLASSSDDKRIGIWEMETQPPQLRFYLEGHTDYVFGVGFDRTGKRLVSGGKDGLIKVWDVENGFEIETMSHGEGMVYTVAWSANEGGRIASAGEDGTIRLWDSETYEEISRSRTFKEPIRGVDFSPDGSMLVSGGMDNVVRLWEVENFREMGSLGGHESAVRDVRFSPSGRWVASAGLDMSVRLWDVANRQQFKLFQGHSSEVTAMAFASDEKGLVSVGKDGYANLWDLNGIDVDADAAFFAPGKVWVARQSPRGELVATIETERGGYVKKILRLRKIDADEGSTKLLDWEDSISGPYADCAFSPDGELLASCAGNEVQLWNPSTAELVDKWVCSEMDVSGVAFSPAGDLMVVWGLDGIARLYDPETRELRGELSVGDNGLKVIRVRFTPDGLHLVTLTGIGAQNSVKIWDVDELKLTSEIDPPRESDSITAFSVSEDSNTVAVGTLSGQVNFWIRDESEFEFEEWKRHGSRIMAMAFLGDNTLASAARDNTMKFWNLEMKREVVTMTTAHMDDLSPIFGVTGFDLSPDRSSVLTTSGQPRVQIWRTADAVKRRLVR